MAPRQRHSVQHLVWRGVVAAASGLAMGAGLYPLATSAGVRQLRRRAGADPALPGGMMVAEWGLALAATVTRPLGFFGLPVGLRPRQGPRPVILLHGYAMSRANFLVLARRLHAAGLGPLYGFEYWTLGSVATAARRLGQFVDAVTARTGATAVDLVGHSMGGVVARYYAVMGGGAGRVAHLVTLGSPHRGTEASLFGVGRPTKELRPGSPLLARLEHAGVPAELAMTVIWSRGDSLVWREDQARVPGAEHLAYDHLGHLGLLASRRVAADVAVRLAR